MSLLTPLYVLGIMAVSLPIIFHLIRRTPRGRYAFSSLMFLSPSPPRLTRRSRLDNILLLILRGLVLTLLALAFARPFLREAANLSLDATRGRRLAILLDTSASMQRAGLWRQALAEVRGELAQLEAADDVALFTFDERLRTVVDFAEGQALQPRRQAARIEQALAHLTPGWSGSDLGAALVTVADALEVTNDRQQSDAVLQIVLISDVQQGAALAALQSYEWPQPVYVSVHSVAARSSSNASLRLLQDESAAADEPRVRISNAADATLDQFYVSWAHERGRAGDHGEIAVHVPPGQSRVVRLPRPEADLPWDRVLLRGDDHPFDNAFFTVPLKKERIRVVFVGPDARDDPEGLHYFLDAALEQIPHYEITLAAHRGGEPLALAADPPRLVVVSAALAAERVDELKRYLDQGGALLVVPTRESAVQLTSFNQDVEVITDGQTVARSDYVMLGEIDFTHPLFADFAAADYSDFTKIHFWNHVRVAIHDASTARVVARFDDGFPALWEQDYGRGKILVLTSGWRLDDSQLALSSKFVPLLMGVLEQAGGRRALLPAYKVNQSVQLPRQTDGRPSIRKPDGSTAQLARQASHFDQTDAPGIYRLALAGQSLPFAVNLDPAESNTTPMDVEQLEQFGLRLGRQAKRSEEFERQRQLRDMELENRQKIWRWLIALALCVLTFETWLAGRKPSGPSPR